MTNSLGSDAFQAVRECLRSLVSGAERSSSQETLARVAQAVRLYAPDWLESVPLVGSLLAAAPSTRWMRDPTRGGLGTIANELAQDTGLAVILDELLLPVDPTVRGACDMLGIDPLYVANEGKFLAVVAPDEAEAAVAALRGHEHGRQAAVIGEIAEQPEAIVALRTPFGGSRIVDMLVGDPLPRIC
jgi:hydrogenase expression/formation protein HypE